MQVFAQGKENQWGHINYIVEYETTRDGPRLGIRWKLTWAIDNGYYFGYNIISDVYTEGTNYGRQIKANTPNNGSGTSYFPSDSDYYWFNKGYGSNQINGCRVIFKSTNGGSITYDTGADRTLTTPTGYVSSNISSNINFDIGNNLNINISDITNQNYNYKLDLDMYVNNTWINIKKFEKNSKNFTLNLADIKDTFYNLLPNSKIANIRINLYTYIDNTYLGTTTANGECKVVNSNPEIPIFGIFDIEGGTSSNQEINNIIAGFELYGTLSNAYIAIKNDSLKAKNGATLKKAIIEWNGQTEEVLL